MDANGNCISEKENDKTIPLNDRIIKVLGKNKGKAHIWLNKDNSEHYLTAVTDSGFRTFSLDSAAHTIKIVDVAYSKEVMDFRVLGNGSCFVVYKDKDGAEDIEHVNLFAGAVTWHGYELKEHELIILEKKEIKDRFEEFDRPTCTAKVCRTQSFDPDFSVFKWPVKGSDDFECLQMFGTKA